MMHLIRKDGDLFAIGDKGEFVGKIINEISGDCCDNPTDDEPGLFAQIFGGHGYIYHQLDEPPNPFFLRSWDRVFSNPELLPANTKNVFVDGCKQAENDFRAVAVG